MPQRERKSSVSGLSVFSLFLVVAGGTDAKRSSFTCRRFSGTGRSRLPGLRAGAAQNLMQTAGRCRPRMGGHFLSPAFYGHTSSSEAGLPFCASFCSLSCFSRVSMPMRISSSVACVLLGKRFSKRKSSIFFEHFLVQSNRVSRLLRWQCHHLHG